MKSYFIKGVIGSFLLYILSTVLWLISSFILAKILGAKEYGIYAYAISWSSLISVTAAAGLNRLLVREVSRYRSLRNWGSLKGVIKWSYKTGSIISLVLGFFFVLIMLKFTNLSYEMKISLLVAVLIAPVSSFILLIQGTLRGLGYILEAQIPQMLVLPSLFFLFIVVFYILKFNLNSILTIELRFLSSIIAIMFGIVFYYRFYPEEAKNIIPEYHQKWWIKSTIPLLFVGVAGIINRKISVVMVGSILGPRAAGIFDVVLNGAALVSLTLTAINMPLAPVVASLYAKKENEKLQKITSKLVRIAFLCSLPMVLIFTLFGKQILLVLGEEFTDGAVALAILSIGQLINVGVGSVGVLLNMTGHEYDVARGVGIGAITNILFNFILIPLLELEGAAIANALSITVWNVFLAFLVYKRLRIIVFLGG